MISYALDYDDVGSAPVTKKPIVVSEVRVYFPLHKPVATVATRCGSISNNSHAVITSLWFHRKKASLGHQF